MRVLFVGFVWPEPTSSAAGQNILSYVNAAKQQNWEVSFCSAAQTTPQTFNLSSIGVNAFPISLNCNSFNETLIRLQPNVVIFDRYLSFEQFAWRVKKSCPNAMLVLDAEDLHFLRSARHLLVKQQKQPTSFMQSTDVLAPEALIHLYNEVALREIACVLQADLTLVLSTFEKDLLVNQFNIPKNQIAHVPFIVNKFGSRFNGASNNQTFNEMFGQKHNVMFIGNFRHAPNYHAAKILAEQCWPRIYKALQADYPNIKCDIYGAYMSPKAKQLENKKIGLLMHGFAPNQLDVIQSARLMLAPISFGAGVKGKLLEAMICNTPSVTTPIGCEGITDKSWAGDVVSNIDAFIDQTILLYKNPIAWQQCAQNGQAILLEDYNPIHNSQRFINAIQDKFSGLDECRLQNFMQSLLSHHQFQTSKYMSQWIEAKNKN